MNEMAHYEVKADGKVVIWMGTQGMGQGLQTSFTQLASELLGIDASQIEIAMGDSDRSAASARWARARPISAARPC